MKKTILILAGLGMFLACPGWGQERFRVTAGEAEIRSRPEGGAPVVGRASNGTILFASGASQSGWVPVDPPGDVAMWVNRDFVEGTRVLARSVQLRTGPGLEYDVAGVLTRGDTVMVMESQGDWLKIAPPSAAQVWVSRNDVEAVAELVAPIREVAEAGPGMVAGGPTGVTYASGPEVWAEAEERGNAPLTPPALPLAPSVAPVLPETPPPARLAVPPPVMPTARPVQPVAHSAPHPAPHPVAPAARPAVPRPAPVAGHPVPASRPVPAAHPQPVTRPSMATPSRPMPPQGRPAAPAGRPAAATADPRLVGELHLKPGAAQGRPVRVTGELRNAPFSKGSPSHFRLMARRGAAGDAECLVHGRPEQLRPHVGKPVAIRGQAYAVTETDLPVVVVTEVQPLGSGN